MPGGGGYETRPDPAAANSEAFAGRYNVPALNPPADLIFTNFSRGRALDFIYTNFRGLTDSKENGGGRS